MLAGLMAAGEYLSYPAHRTLGPAPADLHAIEVTIPVVVHSHVSGWLIPGTPRAGVVLLLHGVRADRREMLGRARFLNRLGYGILLIDLPAHGESPGEHITFGAREAEGVRAALAFLERNQPGEPVGVIGVSLGAASLVLAKPDPAPSAVVLESMYPTIEEGVSNRLRIYLGDYGAHLAPLLVEQLPLRLGIAPAQLHPIEQTGALHCPILIISGSADSHTRLVETQRIFAATPPPKELWIVDGAAHVDLHAFAPAAYETKVAEFLRKYLRHPA
ncbi:MAG TPA: alpha/beta fold hydrolase [Xanthobacteraceae bacterium]|nr:alpha/beta fold hydrolase [Xanthobacteraceae bacterium]